MKLYTLRLKPGQDIRTELLSYAKEHAIKAGSIVTCVGAVEECVLRMAGAKPEQQDIRTVEGAHEIVSLVGTLTGDGCHLHIALASSEGEVIGGHLKHGSKVFPTAEIVIIEDETVEYTREPDEQTGFEELVVTKL